MKVLILGVCLFVFQATGFGQQLVMRGDHADPSVVKIGDSYWASATTSNWFPAYPLLQSKDLVNWKSRGYIFNQLPAWADYYFWAPEITYDGGKVYVYYAAHKKGGNLCLGIASADRPEGPYKDHGPIMCETDGSIDAFPMRDETGKLYIIWKEDGNSVNKATPIWAQAMNEERTALTGEKKELFRNDIGWEANLVEGVSMIKQGEYYYAFYAAAGCCGRECTYQTGVARSKTLLGPWEKSNKNPILTHDDEWKCPGHGTPIQKDGKWYFLYHAYSKSTDVYTGREGMLIEFRFTPDGWIEFVKEPAKADVPLTSMSDNFRGRKKSDDWQWSVFQDVQAEQRGGELALSAMPTLSGAFLGTKTKSGHYTATVKLNTKRTTSEAGLGLIGDDQNTLAVFYNGGTLSIRQQKAGIDTVLSQHSIGSSRRLYLQAAVTNGKDVHFLYSTNGRDFKPLNTGALNGSYLPPWDRSIRVGLLSRGDSTQSASFDKFTLINK